MKQTKYNSIPYTGLLFCSCAIFISSGCKSDSKDIKILINTAKISVVYSSGGSIEIHYASTNPNNVSIAKSDNGIGTWVSYVIKDDKNNIVWPPATGALQEPKYYTMQPNATMTREVSWDGTCYPAFKKTPGTYSVEFIDIFHGTASYQNISIVPTASN